MTSLYTISDEYREAFSELQKSDLPDDVISDTLEGLQGEVKAKAIAVAAFIANLESDAAQMAEAEKRIKERKQLVLNKVARLKQYLTGCMMAADISRLNTPELAVKLNKPRLKVVVSNVDDLPDKYKRIEYSANKTDIKKALDAGEDITGASLELGDTTVSIK